MGEREGEREEEQERETERVRERVEEEERECLSHQGGVEGGGVKYRREALGRGGVGGDHAERNLPNRKPPVRKRTNLTFMLSIVVRTTTSRPQAIRAGSREYRKILLGQ